MFIMIHTTDLRYEMENMHSNFGQVVSGTGRSLGRLLVRTCKLTIFEELTGPPALRTDLKRNVFFLKSRVISLKMKSRDINQDPFYFSSSIPSALLCFLFFGHTIGIALNTLLCLWGIPHQCWSFFAMHKWL